MIRKTATLIVKLEKQSDEELYQDYENSEKRLGALDRLTVFTIQLSKVHRCYIEPAMVVNLKVEPESIVDEKFYFIFGKSSID